MIRIFLLAFTLYCTEMQAQVLSAALVQTHFECNVSCGNRARVLATGGIPPYSFSWTFGPATDTVSGLCGGYIYYASVTDFVGAIAYASLLINDSAQQMQLAYPDTILLTDTGAVINLISWSIPGLYFITPGTNAQIDSLNGEIAFSSNAYGQYIIHFVPKDSECAPISFDTVLIIRSGELPESNIVLYTGITPNGDGLNDYLTIEHSDSDKPVSVKIYNRWGHLVWFTQQYNNFNIEMRWEGSDSQGNYLASGTYFVVVTDSDGNYNKVSWIELSR